MDQYGGEVKVERGEMTVIWVEVNQETMKDRCDGGQGRGDRG